MFATIRIIICLLTNQVVEFRVHQGQGLEGFVSLLEYHLYVLQQKLWQLRSISDCHFYSIFSQEQVYFFTISDL